MKDVVCGMEVKDKTFKSTYMGREYFFCSQKCKEEFDRSPGKYANANERGCC